MMSISDAISDESTFLYFKLARLRRSDCVVYIYVWQADIWFSEI